MERPRQWQRGARSGARPPVGPGSPHQAVWLVPAVALVILAVVGSLAGVGWVALRPKPSPPPGPQVRQQAVHGPNGPVLLRDWPDGRSWLSWYEANGTWAGEPLWADRAWRELASCSAFTNAIVCLNLDPKATGAWKLLPVLLGTEAMVKAGLLPDDTAQPATVVSAYLAQLQAEGVDTWYRFGMIQSPPLVVGNKIVEFYQRVRFEWPVGSQDPRSIRLAPLGKLAIDNKW